MHIVVPTPGSVFQITPAPQMPIIVCVLEALDIPPFPPPTFDWEVVTREAITPSSCPSSRVTCAVRETYPNFGLTPALVLGNWQGGDSTITARTTVNGVPREATVAVRVVGANPDPADVTAALGGAGTLADLIARHESGREQFRADGTVNLGPGGDVGVMQLCSPAATCAQRWNWRENVQAGLALLRAKEASARAYLNAHRVGGAFPNDQGMADAEVLRRETAQQYNGGNYWHWNAAAGQWVKAPPNNYVRAVLGS